MNFRMFALLGAFVVALAAAGCTGAGGPPTGTVSGTVKYKGRELPSGTVTFMNDKGHASAANITDGRYKATVPQGPSKVMVEGGQGGGPEGSKDSAPAGITLPPQYADAEASGLKLEVKSGTQTFDIDLK